MKIKEFKDLDVVGHFRQDDAEAPFSNSILLVKKGNKQFSDNTKSHAKYNHSWFMKTLANQSRATCELIAQEVFRLLIPGHPKTRYFRECEYHCILSKSLLDIKSLANSKLLDQMKEEFKSGRFHGLGLITVVARFVDECDLRSANLFCNEQLSMFKLDGDNCFSLFNDRGSRRRPNKFCHDFTTQDIDLLHVSGHYEQKMREHGTWAPLYGAGLESLEISNENLQAFRNETYIALLKIILLSDSVIEAFLQSYLEDGKALTFKLFLIKQRNIFYSAAIHHAGFQQFLHSEKTVALVSEYIQYLTSFKTHGKEGILSENQGNAIISNFEEMKREKACCTGLGSI